VTASLQSKLASIRELKSKGASFEIEAMFEVLALEKQSVLWRKDDSTKFEAILRADGGVCTPARFKDFKKAANHFTRATIDKLGVPCVCVLAKQNANTRERLLKDALEFRKDHGTEPTYQHFSRLLPSKNGKPTITRTQLLNYIDKCKGVIKECGGRVPVMD
jgi:hypothetical protein